MDKGIIFEGSNGKYNITVKLSEMSFDEQLISLYGVPKKYDFNITRGDFLVCHHIQKTGGTSFGRHLVKNLDVPEYPCTCSGTRPEPAKCSCKGPLGNQWMISRFTRLICGIHATWTKYVECLPRVRARWTTVAQKRKALSIVKKAIVK